MKEIPFQIIDKAANGDRAAFEEIYHACAGYVFNTALRMTRSRESAQDVSQDVFVTLYDHLKDFRHESRLTTWIYRITVNKAINYMKAERKIKKADADAGDVEVVCENSIYAKADNDERSRIIDKLLGMLTTDQRACVVLRNIEGLSYADMARVLNININVVRSRLKRAREKLLSLRNEVMHHEMS
jgi:RNA polymerase sigma-70 factor (ECF subfamily)